LLTRNHGAGENRLHDGAGKGLGSRLHRLVLEDQADAHDPVNPVRDILPCGFGRELDAQLRRHLLAHDRESGHHGLEDGKSDQLGADRESLVFSVLGHERGEEATEHRSAGRGPLLPVLLGVRVWVDDEVGRLVVRRHFVSPSRVLIGSKEIVLFSIY